MKSDSSGFTLEAPEWLTLLSLCRDGAESVGKSYYYHYGDPAMSGFVRALSTYGVATHDEGVIRDGHGYLGCFRKDFFADDAQRWIARAWVDIGEDTSSPERLDQAKDTALQITHPYLRQSALASVVNGLGRMGASLSREDLLGLAEEVMEHVTLDYLRLTTLCELAVRFASAQCLHKDRQFLREAETILEHLHEDDVKEISLDRIGRMVDTNDVPRRKSSLAAAVAEAENATGNAKGAAARVRLLEEAASSMDFPHWRLSELLIVAKAWAAVGREDDANRVFHEAARLLETFSFHRLVGAKDLVKAWLHVGRLIKSLDATEEAEKVARWMIGFTETEPDIGYPLLALSMVATSYAEWKEDVKSRRLVEKADQLTHVLESDSLKAIGHCYLAESHAALDELDESYTLLESAIPTGTQRRGRMLPYGYVLIQVCRSMSRIFEAAWRPASLAEIEYLP